VIHSGDIDINLIRTQFSVLSWSSFFFVIVLTGLIFSSGLFYMVNVSKSDQSGFVLQHIAIALDLLVAMIRRRQNSHYYMPCRVDQNDIKMAG